MAQVIEFETLARFTPTVKWTPDHQRGKVIPFISQKKALYKPVCAAYEELDSESSRWPDCDEAFYRAALEYAQPPILEEEPLLEDSSDTMAKSSSGSSCWACSPTVAQLDHETRDGISLFNRLILLFLALFWTNGMSVIRALHTGSVIGGFNGANARTLLRPLDRKDVSASYESLIP
jgi:hypothetical protein